MSWNFGSSDSKQAGGGTTIVQMPAASADEQEIRRLNLEIAKRQISAFDKAAAEQEADAGSPLRGKQQELELLATEQLLRRLRGESPVLTPEAQQRIATVYDARREEGMRDINRTFLEDAMARGMNVTDSPIANAKGLALGDFSRGLQAARASSELDVGSTEANFQQATQQFQNALRQQAFQNRLSLAGMTPASFGLQSNLFGERLAAAPRSQSTFGNLSGSTMGYGFDLGSVLGGAGGAMRGYGSMSR